MLSIGLRAEVGTHLRTYAALLPLGIHDLDRIVAREAAENPWLELLDRPLAGLCGDESRLASAGPSLGEHLEMQLEAKHVRGQLLRAAHYVVGSLDERAYLREDAATVGRLAQVSEVQAARAIALVQGLEPAGVAARSLGERFRLQLAAAGEEATLAVAITFELDALAAEGRATFAATRGLTPSALIDALSSLRACDPDPAHGFRYTLDRVYPEIVFTRDNGAFQVRVDGRFWPSIRLAALEVTRGLSEPMRQARARARLIVDALARRKTTLTRLATALLDRQRDFFLHNGDIRELVPLSGRELARDLGCAESTVSRGIADRFAETPFGTIPLRAFLVRRPAAVGLTVATVREHVRALATDSPALSDEAISHSLRLKGIRLARRTVAKYRHELGLPSSRARAVQ